MTTERLNNETDFEYKLRLVRAKLEQQIDIDWSELSEILNLGVTGDHLRKTAYGIIEYDNYIKSKNISGHTRILSLSDTHVPFQLTIDESENILSSYRNIDVLQLNGDICDMQSISKFPKVYRASPMAEISEARNYIIELVNYLNPKKVVITYGNHDLRFQNYLANNLDTDILELMPKTSLELIIDDGFNRYHKDTGTKEYFEPLRYVFEEKGINVEYARDWYTQIGDTIFCHPSAYSSGILKTAEKAMLWFRNEGYDFKNLVMAHTHRSGQYTIGNTTIYEQGAFCHTEKMNYADGKLLNSQVKGFIYMEQDVNGNTITERTKLVTI